MPPYQTLYWRGPVMWAFDGRDVEDAGVLAHGQPRLRAGASGR